jgi:large subunit ribosomal protein L30
MAEQSSRDVVDQTLSGGERSPSDVPASTNDKQSAEGDAGETKHIATISTAQIPSDQHNETRDTLGSSADKLGDKDAGSSSMVGFSSSPA